MIDLLFVLRILNFFLVGTSCASAICLIFKLIENYFLGNCKKETLRLGLIFVVVSLGTYCTEEKMYSELRVKAETEYVIYLDGKEVEADTIEFRQYSFYINYDQKAIMLTPKRNYSYRYVSIPIIH